MTLVSDEESASELIENHELIVLNAVTLAVSAVCFSFITYLLVFHAWLMQRNLSTFQYIKQK